MTNKTFSRISEEKQRLILTTAAREFAVNGFHKANINTIASLAGISIGAMYKYFSSKEDLFRATFSMGLLELNEFFSNTPRNIKDPFEKIKLIFKSVLSFSETHPHILQLYLALITPSMDVFAEEYARTIEEVGHTFFKDTLLEGIRDGFIDSEIDINSINFFLDNHLMMFTFSQISRFLKIRQETFLEGKVVNQERIIDETVSICRRIFGKTSAHSRAGR